MKNLAVLTLFAAIAFGGLAYALDISDIIGVIGEDSGRNYRRTS